MARRRTVVDRFFGGREQEQAVVERGKVAQGGSGLARRGPFALINLGGRADLSLVVNSPERADATGEDHRVEASMDNDWPSQVACRDINARKNQAGRAAKIVMPGPYDQWIAAKIKVDSRTAIASDRRRSKKRLIR